MNSLWFEWLILIFWWIEIDWILSVFTGNTLNIHLVYNTNIQMSVTLYYCRIIKGLSNDLHLNLMKMSEIFSETLTDASFFVF